MFAARVWGFLGLVALPLQAQLANPEYYSLFQEAGASTETRLINSTGEVLHTWSNGLNAHSGSVAYLREDGLLLRSGQRSGVAGGVLPGSYGTVQLVDPEGQVLWEFDLQQANELTLHHDFKPIGDENVLVTVWEFLDEVEMEALGWQQGPGETGVWMEGLMEIRPNLEDGSSEIVWEWWLSDHLVQEADANEANFGVVAESPGRVDINFNSGTPRGDYFHISGIDYNPERDEIVLCPNNIDELWVVDHSTTTAEAATSEGGNSGQGGDLIYRWGNPAVYQFGGGDGLQFLSGAHDPRWFFCPEKNEWQLTVHNNDRVDIDPGDSDSQVLELELPFDETGNYVLEEGSAYAPVAPEVLYEIDPTAPFNFSTPFMGGAQKLGNGNLLLTLATQGQLVEVNLQGELVWTADIANGFVFKAQNYPISFAGLPSVLQVNYEVWRDAYFGTGQAQGREPEDDLDLDGSANLLEYYAGSDPVDSSSRMILLPEFASGENGQQMLRVNFQRRIHRPDLVERFEFSRTLEPWVDEFSSVFLNEEVSRFNDSVEAVTVDVAIPSDGVRGFFRVLLDTASE